MAPAEDGWSKKDYEHSKRKHHGIAHVLRWSTRRLFFVYLFSVRICSTHILSQKIVRTELFYISDKIVLLFEFLELYKKPLTVKNQVQ